MNRREFIRIHDDIDISLSDIRAVTVRETDDGQSVDNLDIYMTGDPSHRYNFDHLKMEGFEAVMFDALLKHVLRDNMTITVRGPEKLTRTTYLIVNCRYIEYIRDGVSTIMIASVNWADGTNVQFDGSDAYSIFNKMRPLLMFNASANAEVEADYLAKYRGHPPVPSRPAEQRPPGIGDLTWGSFLSYKHDGGSMDFAEWNLAGHDTAGPMPSLDTPLLHAGNADAFLEASAEARGAPNVTELSVSRDFVPMDWSNFPPRKPPVVESDRRDPLNCDPSDD